MHFDRLEAGENTRTADESYDEEICVELSLQLVENLIDIGASAFTREVQSEGRRWVVTAVRI